MDPAKARIALKLAGTNSTQVRGEKDLGRFGLGLKTASLSQARVLTVLTRKEGVQTALEWDIDHVIQTGRWSLRVLDESDQMVLPLIESFEANDSGTLVLWRNLDLLLGDAENVSTFMAERMALAAEHLELVFHRYLAGEINHKPIRISINGRPLSPQDPFLEGNPATQRSPVERIGPKDSQIQVQSFTLPHLSKLSTAEKKRAHVGTRLRDSQGFYVYRNRRLIDWGSWFRLAPKDELAKLARVRIDVPNSLDGLWALDIKKSRAVPPDSVRRELRRLIERIVGQSANVHRYRGRTDESQHDGTFVWQLVQGRESFSYAINRDHPLLSPEPDSEGISLPRLNAMFDLVEEMFPIHDVYTRMTRDVIPSPSEFSEDFYLAAAREMWARMYSTLNSDFLSFVGVLETIEPFSLRKEPREWLFSNQEAIQNG
jgi:hypothetical protein